MSCAIAGPDPEPQCVGRCGVYVENGPPVRVLSGVGLYVEDDDHNEIFYMKVSPLWRTLIIIVCYFGMFIYTCSKLELKW